MDLHTISDQYHFCRKYTEFLCQPLKTEDYVVQPSEDVSPPKWHLGHTTWFFETFILKPYLRGYQEFDPNYGFLFNSYYNHVGDRVTRSNRGNLTRPTVEEVQAYRAHIDRNMQQLFGRREIAQEGLNLIELGINHEQQHQELLLTDLKYILGENPLYPKYADRVIEGSAPAQNAADFVYFKEGLYAIGHEGEGFHFDNERGRHQVFLEAFDISTGLVSNQEYLAFIQAGGYTNFDYWLADGWDWINQHGVKAPRYWVEQNGDWMVFGLNGLKPIELEKPVTHISYYEADAYAAWKGQRLPSEAEWEIANEQLDWGHRWEWTRSAYLPYPRFQSAEGAVGEYNGKFMINQMVLRGASCATAKGHSRPTYRNFFQPHLRWQFTGIRLAKSRRR